MSSDCSPALKSSSGLDMSGLKPAGSLKLRQTTKASVEEQQVVGSVSRLREC